jgi:hypothetical protein
MMKNYAYSVKIAAYTTALSMSACASGLKTRDYSVQSNPQEILAGLTKRLSSDQAKQYDLISPSQFQAAEAYLSEAQGRMDADQSFERVLEDANVAALRLQTVEENAAAHVQELRAVISAREAAVAVNAQQVRAEEFVAADKEFRDLGHEIEQNDFRSGSDSISDLEEKYSNLVTEIQLSSEHPNLNNLQVQNE